ncbi:MAG: YceD family protein [Pseudomonadota bacterium]
MSGTPLSRRVTVRKAVTRNARYEGVLGPTQMPQFEDILRGEDALAISAQFSRDDEERQILSVNMRARVVLECQRCLGKFERLLESRSALALVLTDEQAQALPREYEPWLVEDEVDLWAVTAEELALALPPVAYHPPGECEMPAHTAQAHEENTVREASPFGVLAELLGTEGMNNAQAAGSDSAPTGNEFEKE